MKVGRMYWEEERPCSEQSILHVGSHQLMKTHRGCWAATEPLPYMPLELIAAGLPVSAQPVKKMNDNARWRPVCGHLRTQATARSVHGSPRHVADSYGVLLAMCKPNFRTTDVLNLLRPLNLSDGAICYMKATGPCSCAIYRVMAATIPCHISGFGVLHYRIE